MPNLKVQPRKHYMKKSSTFKGTLLCRKLASTHTPGSWGGVLAVMDMQNSATEAEYNRLTQVPPPLHHTHTPAHPNTHAHSTRTLPLITHWP